MWSRRPGGEPSQVFEKLRRALAAGGATFADVVKLNDYVTEATQAAVVRDVRSPYIPATHTPASTVVPDSRLARPEWMIDIEAIAVTR